jgi:anti-sigma B factor antagonist
MNIVKKNNGDRLTIALEGRLDTTTSPDLEEVITGTLDDFNSIVFDFENLSYISSAGLRVVLSIQKKMNAKKGTFIIKNVNDSVQEIFNMTGFSNILTIE